MTTNEIEFAAPETRLQQMTEQLGADALALLSAGRKLVQGMIEHEVQILREEVEERELPTASDIADEIDVSELARSVAEQALDNIDWSEHLPSCSDLAEEIQLADLASEIDQDDLAELVAENIAVDAEQVASHIDLADLAVELASGERTGLLLGEVRSVLKEQLPELVQQAVVKASSTILAGWLDAELERRARCRWHRRLWRWLRTRFGGAR